MRHLYLLLTERFALLYSPDSTSVESSVYLTKTPGSSDFIDQVFTVFTEKSDLKGTKVSFVLDRSFLTPFYFSFPLITKRKVDNILRFELENALLYSASEYYFDYYHRRDKEIARTQVGGYAIKKDLLHALVEKVQTAGGEIQWFLALNNLLDLHLQEKSTPQDCLSILWEKDIARFFVYRKGFLVGFSSVEIKSNGEQEKDLVLFQREVNQKVASILLTETEIEECLWDTQEGLPVHQEEQGRLEILPTATETWPQFSVNLEELFSPSLLSSKKRINLFQPNLLIFEDLKKYAKGLMLSAGILLACIGLYMGSLGYEIFQLQERQKVLNQAYERRVSQYLPKGVSRSNAIYVLKERLKGEQEKQQLAKRFGKREYHVSKLLKKISLLKQQTPSLHLDKFSYSPQVITIQGKVISPVKFDLLKDQFHQIFSSPEYSIKINQQSLGDETIRFSISIRSL
ncbi:MAG: hypothetical protein COB67_01380 [SAR324 cluster bacterium]|uniref:GspL cytoplasmic actin-ATPase-like domain-containing protein n=1 Tax=SAR324 cluster bacterium TaxID=2024889 RepID=A0A2A4TBC5_9DELT|nr:MAG: hypothetical protein COB67_01380 [SAR324 cluster bacterium]